MSYNIDNVDVLENTATMRAKDVLALFRDHESDMPEACFIFDMLAEAKATKKKTDLLPLPNFDWWGEGSGHSVEFLEETVAPLIRGTVKCILTWEGGDSVSGFVIRNGKLIDCEVKTTLVEPNQ